MGRQVLKGLGIFLACLIIDQISKAISIEASQFHENPGFIFGIARDLPASLRVIGLSSVFGFLFFFYLLLVYFLPLQLFKLKAGLSLLTGGIFGNVTDRVFRGTSIDFIPLSFGDYGMSFNLADAFQWAGAFLILYNVIIHERIIWYPENQRGKFLVYPKEQLRFASKLAIVALSSSFLLGLFAATYLRNTMQSLQVNSANNLLLFVIAYICLSLIFAIIVFFAGLFFSHRTAGPFFAFEIYVEDLLAGRDREFYLREGDHYKHLESIARDVRVALKKKS